MQEIWKPIPGHTNYAVSSRGRIRREKPGNGTHVGLILRPKLRKDGRLEVHLSQNCVGTYMPIHRAVALAFLGPPPTKKHEVAHWDGKPANNNRHNLRWATKVENHSDRHRHGTTLDGEKNGSVKLTEKIVLKIRRLRKQGVYLRALAKQFGISLSNTDYICRRVSWKNIP